MTDTELPPDIESVSVCVPDHYGRLAGKQIGAGRLKPVLADGLDMPDFHLVTGPDIQPAAGVAATGDHTGFPNDVLWPDMPTLRRLPWQPDCAIVLAEARRRDGSVIVRLLAQQYSFNPQCIVVPAHTKVTFRGTSADVVHGFLVTGTNANAMLVPGYITTFTTEFLHVGEHLMPCHEFCGTAHAAMWAHIRVVAPEAFDRLLASNTGGRCD